jgi:hypothetical protein
MRRKPHTDGETAKNAAEGQRGSVSTASLTLVRRRDVTALIRRIHVELDGKDVAKLWWGHSIELKVPDGVHRLRARLDWTTSEALTVDISSNGAVVEVRSPMSTLWRNFVRPHRALKLVVR